MRRSARRPARLGALVLASVMAGAGLAGCDDAHTLPLAEDVLIDVLTDLHLADARADVLGTPQEADSLRRTYRAAVFDLHGLDAERWDALLDAAAAHPESFESAYDSVLARLAREPSVLPIKPFAAPDSPSAASPRRSPKSGPSQQGQAVQGQAVQRQAAGR